MIIEATTDQAASILACWNGSSKFDVLSDELLHEKLWGDPDVVPGGILVDEREGLTAGFGVAVVREGGRGFIKMYAVAPPFWRTGIGTGLVSALEEHARKRGATTIRLGESAPNYLTPGVDVRYEAAGEFFRRRGYRSIGRTMNLQVDVSSLPHQDLAAGTSPDGKYHVWRATLDDRERVLAMIDENWAAWRPEVEKAFTHSMVSVHVAEPVEGPGDIVAFAAWDTNNHGTGWFGPMGTVADHRGFGLGELLLRRCLEDIRQRGHAVAVIPWVGPVGFYHRTVGAQVARVFERMEKGL